MIDREPSLYSDALEEAQPGSFIGRPPCIVGLCAATVSKMLTPSIFNTIWRSLLGHRARDVPTKHDIEHSLFPFSNLSVFGVSREKTYTIFCV
jgi:hypothetical protein